MLTLTFNLRPIKAIPEVVLSDKEIIPNPPNTSSIAFTATVDSPTTTHIWFDIKATPNETGLRFSQCIENVALEDSTRLTIEWTDPYDPRFDRLPSLEGNTIYMVDPYWYYNWPYDWVYGITTVYNNWEHALTGYLSEIAGVPPSYTLTIYSSPTGVTFTVGDVSCTTPWSGTYSEGTSVSLVMPENHDGYVWSHWLEDGDSNRVKTATMDTDITLTAVYEPVPKPVGGKAVPIDKLIIEPELQTPWMWLSTIILSLVLTLVYVKKRKRNTEIIS